MDCASCCGNRLACVVAQASELPLHHQLRHGDLQSLTDSPEVHDADILLASLDRTQIGSVNVRFERKPLLRDTLALPQPPDGSAQGDEDSISGMLGRSGGHAPERCALRVLAPRVIFPAMRGPRLLGKRRSSRRGLAFRLGAPPLTAAFHMVQSLSFRGQAP